MLPVGDCVRYTGTNRSNTDGNSRWVIDRGVVEHNNRQYLVSWVQLEGRSRSYVVSSEPRESVRGYGNGYDTIMSNWTTPRNFGAGFTRQFRRADADHFNKKCTVRVGKRSQKSKLSVLTCGETEVAKADLKATLKSFK